MRRNHKPMNQCDGQLWQIYIAWADSFRVNLCWATSWRGHFFSKGSVTEFEKCCVLLFVFTCSEMNVDIHKIFYLCCSMRSWYLLLRRQIRAVRREIFDTEVLLECQSVLFSSKRCCMSIYGDLFRSILLASRSTVCKLESSWEHRANRSWFLSLSMLLGKSSICEGWAWVPQHGEYVCTNAVTWLHTFRLSSFASAVCLLAIIKFLKIHRATTSHFGLPWLTKDPFTVPKHKSYSADGDGPASAESWLGSLAW